MGFADPPPYSILLVDQLRDSVQSLTTKDHSVQTTRTVLVALAGDAESSLTKADEVLRFLAEELETAKDASRIAA